MSNQSVVICNLFRETGATLAMIGHGGGGGDGQGVGWEGYGTDTAGDDDEDDDGDDDGDDDDAGVVLCALISDWRHFASVSDCLGAGFDSL